MRRNGLCRQLSGPMECFPDIKSAIANFVSGLNTERGCIDDEDARLGQFEPLVR